MTTADVTEARVRDDLGRALYRCLNRDTLVVDWEHLPDNRQERYRIAAEEFIATNEVAPYLEHLWNGIAA